MNKRILLSMALLAFAGNAQAAQSLQTAWSSFTGALSGAWSSFASEPVPATVASGASTALATLANLPSNAVAAATSAGTAVANFVPAAASQQVRLSATTNIRLRLRALCLAHTRCINTTTRKAITSLKAFLKREKGREIYPLLSF